MAKIACVPVSVSVSRRSWGKPLAPREAPGRPKRASRSGVSGRSMVVPSRLIRRRPRYGAGRVGLGQRARHPGEQLLERGGPEPRPRLGDRRLVGHRHRRAAHAQPAHPLEQAAQDLAIGSLRIEGQGHDIVDHQPRRQLPLPPTLPASIGQHGIDQQRRNRARQHTQRHVIADPRATRQNRCGSCHRCCLRQPRAGGIQPPSHPKSTVLSLDPMFAG